MNPLILFVQKMEDLRGLIKEPNEYNLLRAAAIARHLLMEGHPLAHEVARFTRQVHHFPVGCIGMVEHFGSILPHKPQVFSVGHSINFRIGTARGHLKEREFLALKVAILAQEEYSVRDIIGYCANAAGGVHHTPKGDRLKAMLASPQVHLGGTPLIEQLMDGIGHAIADGFTNSETFVRNRWGITAIEEGNLALARHQFTYIIENFVMIEQERPDLWKMFHENLERVAQLEAQCGCAE